MCIYACIYIYIYTCYTRNTYSYNGNSSSWLQQLCLNTLIDSGGPQLSIPAGHPMTHGFSAALTPWLMAFVGFLPLKSLDSYYFARYIYSASWNFNIQVDISKKRLRRYSGCELIIFCSNQRNQTNQFWWMPAPSASHSSSPSAVLGKWAVIATPDHPAGYREGSVHPNKAWTEEVGRICAGITQ